MKKLPKLDLHGAQLMNDEQLKHILGGEGGDAGYINPCKDKRKGSPCSDHGFKGTCQPTIGSELGCVPS